MTNIFQKLPCKSGIFKKNLPGHTPRSPRGARGAPELDHLSSEIAPSACNCLHADIPGSSEAFGHLKHASGSLVVMSLAPLRQVHLSETESGDRKVLNCQFRSQLLSPRPPREFETRQVTFLALYLA